MNFDGRRAAQHALAWFVKCPRFIVLFRQTADVRTRRQRALNLLRPKPEGEKLVIRNVPAVTGN